MKTLQIKFLGKDKHYRDVYGTEYGAILKNIELINSKPSWVA